MPPTAKLNKQNTFDPAQARTMLAPAVAAFSPPKKKLQEKLKPALYDAYALEEGAADTSAVLPASAAPSTATRASPTSRATRTRGTPTGTRTDLASSTRRRSCARS